MLQHYPNPFLIKQCQKSNNLFQIVNLDVRTTFGHTFPSSQVAMFSPMAIPEIYAQTQGFDY